MTDKVNLIGYTEHIEHYLSQATCFILLSRAETFGLVYIEAMNLGLPIIAWNIPVTNEILPQGNLILNSCSDINSIFSTFLISDESYDNLSKKNKRFVKNNFNESNIMDVYRNLYSNLILN
jgi:glycosyltransferase involved in cell wall biosynthesis